MTSDNDPWCDQEIGLVPTVPIESVDPLAENVDTTELDAKHRQGFAMVRASGGNWGGDE
jgi:hypothetical protein